MTFIACLRDGPSKGAIARITAPQFQIGMQLEIEGRNYIVCDGPAAQYYAKKPDEFCENLAVALRLSEATCQPAEN